MKPSKDLDEQIEEILEGVFSQGVRAGKDIALEKYEDYSAWKRGDEKQQLLALIEQREREARIKEAKFIYENYFDGEEFHPNELVEHIEALQKGES